MNTMTITLSVIRRRRCVNKNTVAIVVDKYKSLLSNVNNI